FSLAAVQPLNVTFDTVGQLCVVQVQRGHDAAVPEGVQIPGFSDWLDLLTVAAQVGVGNSVQRLMHVAYEMDQITERVPVADTRWCAMGELAGKDFDTRRDAVLTGAAFGNISFGILQSQVDVVPIGGSRCFRFVGPGGGAGHGIGDRGWGVANAKELSHTEPGAGFQVISGDTRDGSVAGIPPRKRRHCNEIAQDKRKGRLQAHKEERVLYEGNKARTNEPNSSLFLCMPED